MLAAGCEKVKGFRCAIAFASYALAMRSPRARRIQISSLDGCPLKRRRSPSAGLRLAGAQCSSPREDLFGVLSCEDTHNWRCRGRAKAAMLAVCKILAIIAITVQESCGDRVAVRIRAHSYEWPGAASVPIRLRRLPRVTGPSTTRRQERHRRTPSPRRYKNDIVNDKVAQSGTARSGPHPKMRCGPS